jgi:two-component system phosphate regulon sensor histidine kinase PhoR
MQQEFASFRTRLLWLILLFAVGFGGFATILYKQAKAAFLEGLEAELSGDAHWISLQIMDLPSQSPWAADSICRLASQAKGYRFSLVDPKGKVIGDSHIDRDQLDTLDNHSSRPEVQAAREKGIGKELRYSLTTQMDMLYFAQRIPNTDTVVRVSAESVVLQKFSKAAMRTWAGFAFLFLALAGSVLWWTNFAISAPLLRLSLDARDPQKPLRWNAPFREADVLNRAFEAYVDLIRKLGIRTQHERDRLAGVVERLEEGVLLFDDSGFVRLANGSAYRLLQGRALGESWEGRRLLDVLEDTSLKAFTTIESRENLPPVLLMDKHPGAPFDLVGHCRELQPGEVGEPGLHREFLLTIANVTEFRSLDRSKSEFVANASHELKTPLASIRGYSESLLEGAMENSALRKSFIEKIHNNALRLQDLVVDLLNLSKLEAGETARSEWLPLKAYITSALQRSRSLIESQGLRIEVLVPDQVVWDMEPRDLELILDNLISNAAKYNRPAGKIKVTWEQNQRLVIKDTGVGIPPDILPHIFERFFRGDEARRQEGTGLGLAIVKHAAQKYGFKVWAESQVGEGSRFLVEVGEKESPQKESSQKTKLGKEEPV